MLLSHSQTGLQRTLLFWILPRLSMILPTSLTKITRTWVILSKELMSSGSLLEEAILVLCQLGSLMLTWAESLLLGPHLVSSTQSLTSLTLTWIFIKQQAEVDLTVQPLSSLSQTLLILLLVIQQIIKMTSTTLKRCSEVLVTTLISCSTLPIFSLLESSMDRDQQSATGSSVLREPTSSSNYM